MVTVHIRFHWLLTKIGIYSVSTVYCNDYVSQFVEEYNYYQAGVLPSQFYLALTGKDLSSFKDTLWKMAIIIASVCIVSKEK